MSADASPDNVWLADTDLGAIVKRGSPVGSPGHLPHSWVAHDTLHTKTTANVVALQVYYELGNRSAKGAPLCRRQRQKVALGFLREIIGRHR